MDHYRTPASDVEPPGVRRSYAGQAAILLAYVVIRRIRLNRFIVAVFSGAVADTGG